MIASSIMKNNNFLPLVSSISFEMEESFTLVMMVRLKIRIERINNPKLKAKRRTNQSDPFFMGL